MYVYGVAIYKQYYFVRLLDFSYNNAYSQVTMRTNIFLKQKPY